VAEEVARLRRCLNDLASINALPALWTGAEPPQILETSLDALVGMLDAAFAFARTNDADDVISHRGDTSRGIVESHARSTPGIPTKHRDSHRRI
jgi:hypothetical protein